ncbi:uncharacterized protein LOC122950642 [Acropora millepora]|uniref:uncharacterized protein LOC122950642 n=1 Tax=Acropora millepora TaxID=45264 RepID=UPI001CF4EDF2|nr:uncharacterized protein LOC122950642 [Acropora millepora]
MYQYVIQRTLQGIPGVRSISDDIIVFGSYQGSHDRSLELTLSRLENTGLTLNREKSDAEWAWGDAQQDAFHRLKGLLTCVCVAAHYNQAAETELKVDASPVGLGAILLQRSGDSVRPVAYASRTLTDVQTEKEALAVVWACERFHIYLCGKLFTLYTDHKPLELIYSPKSKLPSRIERWALRLQPHTFKVIACATETAPTLQQVQTCLGGSECPDTPELNPYKRVKDELCMSNEIVLRGSRIVMPRILWQATLSNAHEGHQGIVRTKQMVREKVWWPGIAQQVEAMVKACLPCQSVAGKSNAEPLRPTMMPDRPWQDVHIDLCGPFPSGESLLVCEDACTR